MVHRGGWIPRSPPTPLPHPFLAAEGVLNDLCWIPFAIQSQSVGPEGGKLCLEPSAGAMGGGEEGTILLEVPPGAVSPAESVEVCSALIPDGPFALPEGYQLGSMVVYLYYDGHHLTKPFTLSLPHWYGGEDQVQDGLSFAMAPHALKEGESVYHFKLLEGGRFAEQRRCGLLEISGHCTLFAAVFRVKASSLYYASLWTHHAGGAVIADDEMHSKVVITYADLVWIEVGSSEQYVYCGNDLQWHGQSSGGYVVRTLMLEFNVTASTHVQVLEEYWKKWKMNKMNKATYMNPVRFMFSDDKKVQGVLSAEFGEGWETSLPVVDMVRALDWCRRAVV